MKCSECGSYDAISVKHLPVANGGHITLTEWTSLCPTCIRAQSEKFGALIEAAKVKHSHELAKEVESDLRWRGDRPS